MLSVLGFLIILGPLVIVHEFGHYIFARIFGVKAEIFSVGFGPKLWSRQMGETELRVSAIPLGGYVKLLGEDRETPLPPEEARRALHRQAPWKRFFIFFGGPFFNFLWAILVFMVILAVGEPQTANVIGRVVRNSPAAQAGFESQDKVVSIQGAPVKRFEEIANAIRSNPDKPLEFEVIHPGAQNPTQAPTKIVAKTTSEKGFSIYGESTSVGQIDGLYPMGRSVQAGISNPDSLAAKAGIRTGDRISEVNGTPVTTWEDIEAAYAHAPAGAKMMLRDQKPSGTEEKMVELSKPDTTNSNLGMSEAWGLYSSELFVDKTIGDSPAAKAGIMHGDRLIAVGDKPVESFMDLKDAVQTSGEKTGKVQLKWERDGKIISQELTPTATATKDAEMKATTQYTVGVAPMLVLAEPATVVERIANPFVLIYKGTERMVNFTYRNFVSIGKMFTGNVSVGTLGGPILIGKIAGESLSHGLVTFLTTMAILSIGLGVLNLLPVPILDGGHIVLLWIESLRGKPLSMRQMEIIQGVGLVLILALMGVVMKNDITRLVSF